jgi:hypothetical protein
MQAAPLIGFVTAAIRIKVLAKRKHNKIKKAYEVKPLTEKEAQESDQGETNREKRI